MFSYRDTWVQHLLASYRPYFDITTYADDSALKATCVFHSRSEKYVLVKKAQIWAAETNEYLFLFSVPHLTTEIYSACRDQALELGMQLVKPHAEHMYSYITAIILCDHADADTLQELKRYKKTKNFRLSLHGWMEFRIAAAEIDSETTFSAVTANKSGKDVKDFLLKLSR